MRGFYFVLLISLVFLGSCSPPDSFHTLTGSWELWAFEEPLEGTLFTQPHHVARSVVLTCKDKGKKGKFTAQTVTNVVEGEYELLEDGGIIITKMDGTLFGEPAWGEDFTSAWQNAETYEIQPGQLMIYFNDGKMRMNFEAR